MTIDILNKPSNLPAACSFVAMRVLVYVVSSKVPNRSASSGKI